MGPIGNPQLFDSLAVKDDYIAQRILDSTFLIISFNPTNIDWASTDLSIGAVTRYT